jgi:homoserine kinase type II
MEQKLDHDLIIQILKGYDIGKFIAIDELSPGYANRSYRLETDLGTFLFRWVLEKGIEDLGQEIEILNNLKMINFPTAYPIIGIDGEYITQMDTGFIVLYEFISGRRPRLGVAEATAVGEAVGKLSIFVPPDHFRRKNTINITGCNQLAASLSSAPNQYPDIYEYFVLQTKHYSRHIELGLPKGLVHADIFPDNTLYNGSELLGIIDFEEACWDELLFDLAMTINGFCFPDNRLSITYLESLLIAYTQIRQLTPEEWNALPTYIGWAAHGMLSWHLGKLSQIHSKRQEHRVRELMSRVVVTLDMEEQLTQRIKKAREIHI